MNIKLLIAKKSKKFKNPDLINFLQKTQKSLLSTSSTVPSILHNVDLEGLKISQEVYGH